MKSVWRYMAAVAFSVSMCTIWNPSGLGAENADAASAVVTSCMINAGGETVTLNATSDAASDDGNLYLFAEPIYSAGITTSPIASAPAAGNVSFTVPLNHDTGESVLYSRFYVATMAGGTYVPLNTGSYITNPEAIADHTIGRMNEGQKKGLLVDPAKLGTNELDDLGVKQAIYNIPVSNILGPTTNASYPTINYAYNGRNYQFNGLVVAEYDNIFNILNSKGIAITAVILNNNTGQFPYMIHPMARTGACNYYAFNTAEPDGVNTIEAIGSFLASRYSGDVAHVDNWIIGNEVTAQSSWNWLGTSDLNVYVDEYAKSVRLFYNAIKSENANANIYISIDQQWDRNRHDPGNFDGRDLIDTFNANIISGGNINWDVACHPYPVPLTWASYWNGGAYYRNLVKHNPATPFLTMENIEVLTDYLTTPGFLNQQGGVRSVICSEVGYTSAQGEPLQAAAFVHGYLQAANNQHIDGIMINRETDVVAEIAQGLAFGLTNVDGSHKMIYDYYKYIDTDNAGSYMSGAAAVMGISDWGSVIYAR